MLEIIIREKILSTIYFTMCIEKYLPRNIALRYKGKN